jgi:hypothetical protein
MGRVADKLNYTQTWVDDIYRALKEKGIKCDEYPLEKIGNEIRKLHRGEGGGDEALFGMQTGMRSQPLAPIVFEGDLENETACKLAVPVTSSDPNHPTYNTIDDYHRVVAEITGFEYQHELKPVLITNEREEF